MVFDGEAASSLVKELRVSFSSGKTRSYEWRISQVKALLKMMAEREDEIVDALRSDLAKPPLETVVYEIGMFKNSCELVLRELKQWMTPEKAKTSITTFPSSAEIIPEPLGVVLVISAWNYPFLLSLDPVVGAIAAGNAVVLKPSEIAPASSSLLAKLLGEYLDNSSIRVVEGAVDETTALLQQKWDKIFYTGNGKVGRIVMAAAAKHLTPVVLELGGKSPTVVDSNVNLEVAARRIISGKWGCNNGQACISPDYLITTKEFAPKLVDALKTELENCFGKNPIESNDLSRIVNSNHFARLLKFLDDDKVSGKIVYGGEKDESKLRIAPTILLDVPQDSLIMSEEIFGPLLPIVTVRIKAHKKELILCHLVQISSVFFGYFLQFGSARAVNRRYISDCVPLKIRIQASAGFVSASALGMACGPALAGLLQTNFKIYNVTFNQDTLPGWVMTIAWLIYSIWLWISFVEPSREFEEDRKTDKSQKSNAAPEESRQPATSIGSAYRLLTPSVKVQLLIYFMLKYVMEILLAESSVITTYYFKWSTGTVAIFLAGLGLTVLPINIIVGSYVSNWVDDRQILLASEIMVLIGIVSAFHVIIPYSELQYICSGLLMFVSAEVLEVYLLLNCTYGDKIIVVHALNQLKLYVFLCRVKKGHQQDNGWACGYYVMKNMFDIIDACIVERFNEIFTDTSSYEKESIDHIRQLWAQFFLQKVEEQENQEKKDLMTKQKRLKKTYI
ncbi:betaine aldehyde dehydrogenase, chloroplastic [Lathyrus oleraceus]|uniref:betaine aldehyde dehydrogenase, chloroplastic n=1 Tax=Pisum sativum TaxID=3888 RepID=UPI0021D2D55F|nr:betaine aldehyde dehydrogenase, chloroplastic-like [Pisum sativum]